MQLATMTTTAQGFEEAEYEALPPLNPLQTSHNHLYISKPTKANRFSFIESDSSEKIRRRSSRGQKIPAEPARSDSTTMKRRSSRLGMFGLFTRTKNSEFQATETPMPTPLEEEEPAEKEPEQPPIEQVFNDHSEQTIPKDDLDADVQATSLRRRASKRALKTKESFTRQKPKCWEPPPLFQAYPQSVKHATLSTPVTPAEALIKSDHERQQKITDPSKYGDVSEMTKKQRDKKLRKSQAFELASNRDWDPKVFALVTEGYLLQYSGHGSHDRLPEKILPLCKQSAAFATDVIRGKPFVLQISQISGDDGTIDTDLSKDLLRKVNLKSEMKRAASAFLLVLGSPEEMNEWLVAVRKEIQIVGGKEYRPEIFGTDGVAGAKPSPDCKTSPTLQRVPSQRYLVKRDPYRFSPKMPESPRLPSYEEKPLEQLKTQPPKGLGISNRYSLATSDSTYSRYQSDTTASIDQAQLDKLRETPRQSYMSNDAKTASTSRCSSLDRSPPMGRNTTAKDPETSEELAQERPADQGHVKSVVVHYISQDQATPTPDVSGVSTPTAPVASPVTPNFSVPTFSKRFSATPVALASRSTSQASQTATLDADQGSRKTSVEGRPTSVSAPRRISLKQEVRPANQRPWSAESNPRPQSAGSDAKWSRRNSSLNYARGISPRPLPRHSPSPHPPPTGALPPLPTAASRRPSGNVPPPTAPPPPPPMPTSPPAASLSAPTLPASNPGNQSAASTVKVDPLNVPAVQTKPDRPRKLRRPVSMQVRRRPPTPPNSQHAVPGSNSPVHQDFSSKPRQPSKVASETRRVVPQLPSAPPPSPKLPRLRTSSQAGETGSAQSPKSPDNAASFKATVDFDSEIPAYIPPIRVSDRRSGLSLDGPWNHASFAL